MTQHLLSAYNRGRNKTDYMQYFNSMEELEAFVKDSNYDIYSVLVTDDGYGKWQNIRKGPNGEIHYC